MKQLMIKRREWQQNKIQLLRLETTSIVPTIQLHYNETTF
jgi:hypothetical protein